ncbi:MAG: hypothetical protein JWQ03_2225 [Variovorax sp.]|nr:hypothetical protein [Variovorax sp.]
MKAGASKKGGGVSPRPGKRQAGKPSATPQPKARKANGRPPLHTRELARDYCEHLMGGCTLREASAKAGMPSVATVLRWLHDDVGGFCAQYARAREVQAELDVDDTVRLADQVLHAVKRTVKGKGKTRQVEEVFGDAVERSRLMVEARKWRAGKMAPKKYGLGAGLGEGDGLALVVVRDLTGRKDQQAEGVQP